MTLSLSIGILGQVWCLIVSIHSFFFGVLQENEQRSQRFWRKLIRRLKPRLSGKKQYSQLNRHTISIAKSKSTGISMSKVRNIAKIGKRYNQVPHLTQDTIWESNKNTINITNKSQEVSPFPAGDYKAAMNRRESMGNTRHKTTNDQQKKYSLGTVSKIFYWRT